MYSSSTRVITLQIVFLLSFLTACYASSEASCDASVLQNSAFLFVKPHANTKATRELVKEKLVDAGINILSEHDISGEEIDENKLIDQHYYSIASKATILPAEKIPVPISRFNSEFNESWDVVLAENRACNALEACERFNCNAEDLNRVWKNSDTKIVKFGGGFYCGLVKINDKSLYVFNAFFMSMRAKFVAPGSRIHCYVVQWEASKLNWRSFRKNLLGSTNPGNAPEGSIRRLILENYQSLGIKDEPNEGDNGVHASASPFEGLAEKINWLSVDVEDDDFGRALLENGISKETIIAWSTDPLVNHCDGSMGSIFDALEDLDAEDCKQAMIKIKKING